MSKVQSALDWALGIARDNSHGYDQTHRWGPDYDCSALVISAFEQAGIPVKSKGGATYTGNMFRAFTTNGFAVVRDGTLQAGDVLLNERNHTAIYAGGGYLVQASINEKGTVSGGQTGDQTGREINISPYYNYPWDYVLRYTGADEGGAPAPSSPSREMCEVSAPLLRRGDNGMSVRALQSLLLMRGCQLPVYGVDGDFGDETLAAVKTFQTAAGLDADGEVGSRTWTKLLN